MKFLLIAGGSAVLIAGAIFAGTRLHKWFVDNGIAAQIEYNLNL